MLSSKQETRTKILSGIDKTVDLVKMTLGSRGKTVLIADKFKLGFSVTKDGVTVARAVELEDDLERCGSELVKNAANKTVQEVGDNTTTTCILTQSMCNTMESEIQNGKNPNDLIRDLNLDLEDVVKFIKTRSHAVKTISDLHNVAKVSSNNDPEIADTIGTVYSEAGFDVVIDLVESDKAQTEYEVVQGYTLEQTGYTSPIFVNNFEKSRVEFKNPRVYIYNGKIRQMTPELMKIFLVNQNRNAEDYSPLVIVCEDIEEIPLREVYAAVKEEMIHDVCIVKSNLISQDRRNSFVDTSRVLDADYTEDRFSGPGTCQRIVIEKDSVTFISGAGDTSKYTESLREALDQDPDNIGLKQRVFNLENRAAVIKVGGRLQTEIQEKKDRFEDAVYAVRSALEEGYSAGASSVFIEAQNTLDLRTQIMKSALLECYKQLMWNAELEPYYYLREIHDKGSGYGFNLNTQSVGDMLKDGIYDSTKGLRVSLENSVATACNFALINGSIV